MSQTQATDEDSGKNNESRKEELPSNIQDHLERWKKWADNSEKVGDSSVQNYYSSIKKFFRESNIEIVPDSDNMVDQISEESEDVLSQERISNHLTTEVTSRSMKYGINKYFEFLDVDATTMEGMTRVNFLKTTLNRLDFDDDTSSDIGEKVISPQRVRSVCSQAEEKDSELGLSTKFMYETATRAIGVKLLLWKDVNRDNYQGQELNGSDIFIHKDRSKSKESRVVKVSDDITKRLKEMEEEREPDPNDVVFFPDLKRDSVYKKIWRFFDNDIDFKVTPHYFRHSRLTHLTLDMYENSDKALGSIKEYVKDYAGHRQMETTERYIELAEEEIKRKENIMEDYRNVEWE